MAELLIEIFSEEIPARMQAKASADFKRLMLDGLREHGLKPTGEAQNFVTPRRLTLAIDGLPLKTPDIKEERKGPREGAPEKALEGFMRGAGVTKDQLELREVKGNNFYFATIEKAGRDAESVIAEVLEATIRNFPWPKSQRWGDGNLRWVRPLQAILCLFEGKIVAIDVDGIKAGNLTYGHRFMSPAAIEVSDFTSYRTALGEAKVMLDAAERQTLIREACSKLAADAGLDFVEDKGLLAEVAGLVEWPVPMLGGFDPAFLEVPEEVLILTMKKDQKYFVLRDKVSGKLAPYFIFTANIIPADGGALVRKGNERVLSARLSDARFFYEQDLKTDLASRVKDLGEITFHKELGTVFERVERIAVLSNALAKFIPDCDGDKAKTAARLAKADLVSQMVYEFPEVQGVMGRYYALAEGQGGDIADAIRDHYAPLGPSDICPTAPVSVAVALAEKIDTLVGFFGINQPPTGSKDPYALRRAALGVIRLITENRLRIAVGDLIERASGAYGDAGKSLDETAGSSLFAFLQDRLKVIMKDQGVRHDLIDAVFAKGKDDIVDVLKRVRSLQIFLGTEDGANLLAGYKRGANILKAEEKKGQLPEELSVRADLLEAASEAALHNALQNAKAKAAPLLQNEDYEGVMQALAALRGPIDAFFEDVIVNADDSAVRSNRLALLSELIDTVEQVADFGAIEG